MVNEGIVKDPIKDSAMIRKAIGDRIRKLRTDLEWSLDKLAEITGLSKGYLSQIENCEKNPPIGTLTKIAYGLNVDVVYLITGENQRSAEPIRFSHVKAGEGRPILHRAAPFGYEYESVNFHKTNRLMDAYIVSMDPELPEHPFIHEGQEVVYALEGRFVFIYDGRETIVEPGDCLSFDSSLPHYSYSLDGKPARVLVVFTAQK
jgi:transcriptional regulator with XRE-family HTH domain